jgi:hypothetical protein
LIDGEFIDEFFLSLELLLFKVFYSKPMLIVNLCKRLLISVRFNRHYRKRNKRLTLPLRWDDNKLKAGMKNDLFFLILFIVNNASLHRWDIWWIDRSHRHLFSQFHTYFISTSYDAFSICCLISLSWLVINALILLIRSLLK